MIFDSAKEIKRLRKELCEANKKISYQLQRIIDLEDDNKALESVIDSLTDIGKMYSEIRSEVAKEFAKLLVDKAENGVVSIADLPDYVKEMVGEG